MDTDRLTQRGFECSWTDLGQRAMLLCAYAYGKFHFHMWSYNTVTDSFDIFVSGILYILRSLQATKGIGV